ncbi:MAG: hypothetical protein H8D67_13360 [Deltaproteobacteria bacterium]|nr:hypothetical protein [Deltaproteobacteria bacterium]
MEENFVEYSCNFNVFDKIANGEREIFDVNGRKFLELCPGGPCYCCGSNRYKFVDSGYASCFGVGEGEVCKYAENQECRFEVKMDGNCKGRDRYGITTHKRNSIKHIISRL